MKLIEVIDPVRASPVPDLEPGAEAAFVLPRIKRLKLVAPKGQSAAGEFLAHQAAREPEDLRAHVQRIFLHIGEADAEGAYGALVDLFIVLGENGDALRRRMLAVSAAVLGEGRYKAIEGTLDEGLLAADPLSPGAPSSMLTKGTRGTHLLVEREAGHAVHHKMSLLDEARSYVEYGQIEEARALLEEAVLNEPWHLELHQDLLDIYLATRDIENFNAMHLLACDSNNQAKELWDKTAVSLGVASGD